MQLYYSVFKLIIIHNVIVSLIDVQILTECIENYNDVMIGTPFDVVRIYIVHSSNVVF